MERLVDMGLTKHIGMSNMTIPKLEAVLTALQDQTSGDRDGASSMLPAAGARLTTAERMALKW